MAILILPVLLMLHCAYAFLLVTFAYAPGVLMHSLLMLFRVYAVLLMLHSGADAFADVDAIIMLFACFGTSFALGRKVIILVAFHRQRRQS